MTHPPFAGAGFHVLLKGPCWLFTAGAEPIALTPGDVVFLRNGIGHTLTDDPATAPPPVAAAPLSAVGASRSDGPATTVLLCGAYQFDRQRTHPLLDTLPEVIHLPTQVGRHRALRAAIELLGDELEQARPGADAVLPSLLDVLLLYTVRAWYDDRGDQPDAPPWAAALRDQAISAALRDIHNEPGRPWTVQALGQRAGLSRAAFARRFTELVGQPPLAYLTWWRMTLAAGTPHSARSAANSATPLSTRSPPRSSEPTASRPAGTGSPPERRPANQFGAARTGQVKTVGSPRGSHLERNRSLRWPLGATRRTEGTAGRAQCATRHTEGAAGGAERAAATPAWSAPPPGDPARPIASRGRRAAERRYSSGQAGAERATPRLRARPRRPGRPR